MTRRISSPSCSPSRRTEARMFEKDYTVVKIEGEYAYLRDVSGECTEDIFIALALLPAGVDVGVKLHYENFSYEIV